ncbi:PDZ domain-containing protein [Rhizobium sullae]|uniref:PDZ domain-containing protein n=1 Tax=Rhizobium sullae TaxID=50338 RepID=A0A4R3Q3N3_RHISU|nr:PDZ domain-containing protein [Rhizobium sullae]
MGVGFAIPSDEARAIVAKLQKDGSIAHGYLGVQIQAVTKDVADAVGLSAAQGALVAAVSGATPAARAAAKTGDIITAVGRETVKTPKDLSRLVADMSPGARETLTVWRDGQSTELTVTIGGNDTGEKEATTGESSGRTQAGPGIGISLADLTPHTREELNLPRSVTGAVVASVNPGKPAAEAGILTGDVVVSVNDKTVQNAGDVKNAVTNAARSGRKSVLLLVERGGNKIFVAVPFAAA